MLDVRDLIRIEAVAAHGGFTRAATALGMTQPALTRSIAAAERMLGGQLFRRGRRGAEPTSLCRMVLADAREVIGRMRELHERLAQLRGGSGEEISVAAGPFPLETICLPAVRAFQASHPRIRVRLESLAWPAALAQLRARLCDLAVVTADASFEGTDMVVAPLPAQRLAFVVRRDHPLAGATADLSRILAYPLVTTAHLSPRLHAVLTKARGDGVRARRPDLPFPAVLVESASAWIGLLEGTDNVALTTLGPAAHALVAGDVVLLAAEAPSLTTRHALVHLAARPPTTTGAAFMAALKDANADAIALAERLWEDRELSAGLRQSETAMQKRRHRT